MTRVFWNCYSANWDLGFSVMGFSEMGHNYFMSKADT